MRFQSASTKPKRHVFRTGHPPMQKLAKANHNHMIGRSRLDSHAKNRPFSLKIRHSIFLGKQKPTKRRPISGILLDPATAFPAFSAYRSAVQQNSEFKWFKRIFNLLCGFDLNAVNIGENIIAKAALAIDVRHDDPCCGIHVNTL